VRLSYPRLSLNRWQVFDHEGGALRSVEVAPRSAPAGEPQRRVKLDPVGRDTCLSVNQLAAPDRKTERSIVATTREEASDHPCLSIITITAHPRRRTNLWLP
jgi:hypothetical protein